MATLKNIMAGLEIVAKHVKEPEKAWLCAEHDILFMPLMNDTEIPPEDEAALKELGAHRSSEGDCWAFFT